MAISKINQSFLEYLYLTFQVGCQIYDSQNKLIIRIGDFTNIKFSAYEKTVTNLRNKCGNGKGPVVEVDNDMFIFGAFLDDGNCLYLFGPVAWSTPGIEQMFEFYQEYGISMKDVKIPVKSYEEIMNMLALGFIQINHEKVSDTDLMGNGEREKNDIVTEEELSEYQSKRSIMDIERLGQLEEADMCRAIAIGDVEYFQNRAGRTVSSLKVLGDMAQSNRKKIEYLFVTVQAQVRMTAVNAGLSFSEACDLSDLYLHKLEKCKNNDEILNLMRNMRIDYATRVRREKQNKRRNYYVEFCKDYIAQRITKNIRASDIADHLGVSTEYLSKVFSEHEGMTMTEYRIKMKLKAARNQLKYSQYSIAEIAEYFSFSSPSRFSAYFKKEFGMTPLNYRKENQVMEFIEKK